MSRKRIFLLSIVLILTTGFLIPQRFVLPVEGMDRNSYHPQSFWYYPWGKSGTHKGVDIFAKKGTTVRAATGGMVVYTGEIAMGGRIVLVLGPKWRMHYYAHLNEIKTKQFSWLGSGTQIGSVGDTGNAKGKQPHLHYTIFTLIPYPWRMDTGHDGWKKMFYLNPIDLLKQNH